MTDTTILFGKEKSIERPVERTAAFTILVTISPLLLFSCLLIALVDRQNPIFVQERRGLTKNFNLYKLRTMKNRSLSEKEEKEFQKLHKLKNDPRCTFIGKILRKTSIDEIPQLWNIVKGDMTFIGPRPVMVNQRQEYFGMIPGLTGLTQALYRNKIRFESRRHLERFYSKHKSFSFDIYILVLTLFNLFKMNGE